MNEPFRDPVQEPNPAPDPRPLRRICNRIGWGMLCYCLVMALSSSVLYLVLDRIAPAFLASSLGEYTVNDVATYLFGPLGLYLVLRPLPSGRLPERSMTLQRMGKLTLEGIGLLYGLSLVTELMLSGISTLTGYSTGNLLDSVTDSVPVPVVFLFMAVIAPICEEWIFRHLLLRRLLPLGQEAAVAISALCFGLFHGNFNQFFYATAVGLLYGCVVVKTGRLRYTIVFHMILNFLGSVVPLALENFDLAITVYTVAVYALMIVGLVILAVDLRQKQLWPARTSPAGWKKAAFTAPGMIVYIVILGALSIATPFTV
jgi:membrane protease YdiL (CAAX protease family)